MALNDYMSRFVAAPTNTLATYYPVQKCPGVRTAKPGESTAANINAFTDTVSTTATDGVFDPSKNLMADGNPGTPLSAIVHFIQVLVVGAGGNTVQLQDHTGTKNLTPAIPTAVAQTFYFEMPVLSGFRIVLATGTAALVLVNYSLVRR